MTVVVPRLEGRSRNPRARYFWVFYSFKLLGVELEVKSDGFNGNAESRNP